MNPLRNMLDAQAAARRATATVEWEIDSRQPTRTAYRITGATADVVQGAIDARMREAEESPSGGYANFSGPTRTASGFEALGEVVRL